jgi:hypothetical protein
MKNSEKRFIKTFLYGDYFCPASSRYDDFVEVGCDRCSKERLICCISWKHFDLCMDCVVSIERDFERGRINLEDFLY